MSIPHCIESTSFYELPLDIRCVWVEKKGQLFFDVTLKFARIPIEGKLMYIFHIDSALGHCGLQTAIQRIDGGT